MREDPVSQLGAIRQAAEVRYTEELTALRDADTWARPPGWQLSPRMVETFIMGTTGMGTTGSRPLPGGRTIDVVPKFVGDRRLIQVAIATLASDRALMLAGEPGTAKSWLSEHLAAAISGTSQLVVQGTAGTTEEQVKYSWNYALLIAEGPSHRALIESPILRGMQQGLIVRFEEMTRCAAEVQDALISVLSEKQVAIPELGEIVPAQRGFAIIATANTRDRGVNEMSSALKRRFNFVTIPVVADVEQEAAIVAQRSADLLRELDVDAQVPREVVTLLTTVFAELRRGQTLDGKSKVKSPSTVLSTAELISVMTNGALMGSFFGEGRASIPYCVDSLVGAVVKENAADLTVLDEYLETIAKQRNDAQWRELYSAGKAALGS
jgi:MoxR-like ATPase